MRLTPVELWSAAERGSADRVPVSSRDKLKALNIIAGPLDELDSNGRTAGCGSITERWRRRASARQEATYVSHACIFVAVAAAARARRSSKSRHVADIEVRGERERRRRLYEGRMWKEEVGILRSFGDGTSRSKHRCMHPSSCNSRCTFRTLTVVCYPYPTARVVSASLPTNSYAARPSCWG